jgi:hypothetical protein
MGVARREDVRATVDPRDALFVALTNADRQDAGRATEGLRGAVGGEPSGLDGDPFGALPVAVLDEVFARLRDRRAP